MTELNDNLRAPPSTADEAFLADFENGEGFFKQLFATFRGPQGWVGILIIVAVAIILGVSVWFVWEAFHAETAKETVLWMGGAITGFLGQGIMRLFLASRMHMLAIMRELKRIELRVVKLSERLD